jgi:pilus assembly protein CpaE
VIEEMAMEDRDVLLVGLGSDVLSGVETRLRPVPVAAVPSIPADTDRLDSVAVVAVALQPNPAAAFVFVARLSAAGTRSVVVGPSKDPDLILGALRAGASEFVLEGDTDLLANAVRNLLRTGRDARLGTVITVFGAKGGVGSTTVAVNLAGALQRRNERTVVVDINLELGDVLASLDVPGSYGIADVLRNMHRLDRDLVDKSIPKHRSGLHVLGLGDQIEEAGTVDAAALARVLEFLRTHFEWIVIDGARGFSDVALATLDASERVVLVVSQEVTALRNAKRCAAVFRRLGYPDERVRLVVNRYHKRARVPDDLLAETVTLPISATVANDYLLVERCVHNGSLVFDEDARSPVSKDLGALVKLVGEPAAAPAEGSLIRKLFTARTVAHGTR